MEISAIIIQRRQKKKKNEKNKIDQRRVTLFPKRSIHGRQNRFFALRREKRTDFQYFACMARGNSSERKHLMNRFRCTQQPTAVAFLCSDAVSYKLLAFLLSQYYFVQCVIWFILCRPGKRNQMKKRKKMLKILFTYNYSRLIYVLSEKNNCVNI